MATNSATMTTRSSTKCPWRQFYKCIIKYMDSLHTEPCKPQMKIYTFIHAIKHSFPSPTMDPEKHEKSTKQTQTIEQPKMAQGPSSSTKRTSNSDTDSANNTESESNSKTSHISTSTHLPKPSTSTRPDTQTTVKQPILPAPKTSTASTYHQRTRKTPLLPTPPSPVRNFNYGNHYKQYITRPSAFNNGNPTFTRP